MMRVTVDPRSAFSYLTQAEEKQFPYAVSLALNRLANKAQAAEQKHIKQAFKLRREAFVLRGVKIAKQDRASKTSWVVVISLAYPDDRHFLDQHEPGGQRKRTGGRYLWQPNQQVFKSKVIAASNPLAPKNLHMHRNAHGQIQGEQRTFMVRTQAGQRLVLQRVDRKLDGRSSRGLKSMTLDNFAGGHGPRTKKESRSIRRTVGTRLLYRLVSSVKIPARLQFVETVSSTAKAEWGTTMRAALAEALKGAR